MILPFRSDILPVALLGVHLAVGSLVVAASAVWPAAGAAAMLVPLGMPARDQAFAWMAEHDARLLATEASGERLVVVIPTSHSALSALAHGYLPVATQAVACEPPARELPIQKGYPSD